MAADATVKPSDAPVGLRERKKQRRRVTIAAAALRLFERQGFRATTVAQVAAAAEVSPRTVFAYFPTKEDLLFPESRDTLADLASRLEARPDEVSAGDALRAWVGEYTEHMDPRQESLRRRIIEADVDLRAHEQRMLNAVGDVLTVSLARDLGTDADDVMAQMAAAAAVGALMSIGRRARADADEHCAPRREAALALIDDAMAFVDGGIQSLRARSVL